jgi:hypothetical protein
MRYIDAPDPFARHRIETALSGSPAPAAELPQEAPLPDMQSDAALKVKPQQPPQTRLELHLYVERNNKLVRGTSRARASIEQFCLSDYRTRCLDRRRDQ